MGRLAAGRPRHVLLHGQAGARPARLTVCLEHRPPRDRGRRWCMLALGLPLGLIAALRRAHRRSTGASSSSPCSALSCRHSCSASCSSTSSRSSSTAFPLGGSGSLHAPRAARRVTLGIAGSRLVRAHAALDRAEHQRPRTTCATLERKACSERVVVQSPRDAQRGRPDHHHGRSRPRASFLGGVLVIEKVFGWPGLGELDLAGGQQQRHPVDHGHRVDRGLLRGDSSTWWPTSPNAAVDPRVAYA